MKVRLIIDKILCKLRYFRVSFQKMTGYYNVLIFKLYGIKIGKKCEFRGKCLVSKAPGSLITIGNDFKCFSVYKEPSFLKCRTSIQTNESSANLIVGNNVGMGGVKISCFSRIVIGNNVKIGGNTTIMDGDYHPEDYRSGDPKEIVIEDNVWIGYSCIILKGVHIGKNTVIGAGSVVTKDIPQNVIAAGVPCKVIKKIEDENSNIF